VRIRRSDNAIPLYPLKLALNFADQWRSLSRYSSHVCLLHWHTVAGTTSERVTWFSDRTYSGHGELCYVQDMHLCKMTEGTLATTKGGEDRQSGGSNEAGRSYKLIRT
jgi:hypothetical protein